MTKRPPSGGHGIHEQYPDGIDYDVLENDPTPITLLLDAQASTPEKALIAAIIVCAFDDARGVSPGITHVDQQRQAQRDAREWLRDGASENALGGATWSIRFCCQALDWPYDRLLRNLGPNLDRAVPRLREFTPLKVGARKHGGRAA